MTEPLQKPVFARVERDIASGDIGSARRRLESHAKSQPYDPDLLVRLGEIALQMGDPVAAGRWFFLSSASGPEADAAIEAFARAMGRSPRAIASQLRRLRSDTVLPPIVEQRLGRFGVQLGELSPTETAVRRDATLKEQLLKFGCLLALAATVVVLFAGLVQIVHWLSG